jgi:hypothetical protein
MPSRHSPEAKEVLDLFLAGLVGDILDVHGSRDGWFLSEFCDNGIGCFRCGLEYLCGNLERRL